MLHEESRYPYGLERGAEGVVVAADYVYTGKEYDAETGLIYFGGRYYSPEVGRWITADPLFIENPGAAVEKPLSAYLYSYVRNNPMSYVDEEGELEKGLFEADHRLGVYGNITL